LKKILFRADAFPPIGTGHLMRCIAVAQSIQNAGIDVVFYTRCQPPALIQLLLNEQFKVITHNNIQGGDADVTATINVLESLSAEQKSKAWLVVDGYGFGSEYLAQVMAAGYRLMLLDDNIDRATNPCDLLLNMNLGAERLSYGPEAKRTLLGSDFIVLRSEFLNHRHLRGRVARSSYPLKLLITIGGEDPLNISQIVMDATPMLEGDIHTTLVVGPANKHIQSLRPRANQLASHVSIQVSADMPGLMSFTDLAVTGGGYTCWELAYMGVPFLVFSWAENQLRNAQFLDQRGIAVNIGWHEDLIASEVAEQIKNLMADRAKRMSMGQIGSGLVDGLGGERIVNEIMKIEEFDDPGSSDFQTK